MSLKFEAGIFPTSDDFITSCLSSDGQLKKFKKAKRFIDNLVTGDPEPGKHGLYPGEFERAKIVKAMIESGLVRDPDTFLGRLKIARNLRKIHQTNYWKGYCFIKLTGGNFGFTLYKVRRIDVSGGFPG